MKENASHTPRRWQRQPSKIPISVELEHDHLKADNSALAVDISPHGASVLTKLGLAPGEWVKVFARGKFRQAIAGLVIWVRKEKSSLSTLAGLELF
jgi:hypothetical protein